MATCKAKKLEQQAYISMHDSVVQDILDKTDIPFANVETIWFRKGQQHRYKDNRWTSVRRLCKQALEQITAEQKD